MNGNYTQKQLNILLCLRKSPQTANYLKKKFNMSDSNANINLSLLGHLYYTEDGKNTLESVLTLNEIGETVAQAEYDRRFDMYYTRAVSFAALVASIIALVLQAIK